LSKKFSNKVLGMFSSIIVSKLMYYLIKFLLINTALMGGDLISTSVYIQVIMLFVLSGYVYLMSSRKQL
jgi:hypothetical protein